MDMQQTVQYRPRRRRRRTSRGGLPPGLTFTQRAVAALRAYLLRHRMESWCIFHCSQLDLYDVDEHLQALEVSASWEPLPLAEAPEEPLTLLTRDRVGVRLFPGGVLRLDRREVVLARWYWLEPDGSRVGHWLCAVPSADRYQSLLGEVRSLRRARGAGCWQVVQGSVQYGSRRVPREAPAEDELFLDDSICQRLQTDVLSFFSDEVARLYQDLRVPYRRGVLMHGPPGNGKTSIIRLIGARLPEVPGLILRPSACFDSDDFEDVLRAWRRQAPAMLVIEDLNWLLKEVNVSTFLNCLDGVEEATGGLMLIATTNHPEELDPAINNRPGRFDVTIEVCPPRQPQRDAFFRAKLCGIDEEVIRRLVTMTEGLSFAHLQEILRHSGLLAIQGRRAVRNEQDLLRAAEVARNSSDQARCGFPLPSETPFGLAALARGREES